MAMTMKPSAMPRVLPRPLSEHVFKINASDDPTITTPRFVKVTTWGSPLEGSRIQCFYFGGMPCSSHEPALHGIITGKDDLYKSLGIHLIAIDKPGMGGSDFNPRFSVQRDWPLIVNLIADEFKLTKYGVFGISNGGPYVIACLVAADTRLKAAAFVVGASDVSASGYFSWRHPSGMLEGCFNSLPFCCTAPVILCQLKCASCCLFTWPWDCWRRCIVPDCVRNHRDVPGLGATLDGAPVREVIQRLLGDAAANGGLGAALDCQQVLSPLQARPNAGPGSATAELSTVEVPVQLWFGSKDSTVPTFTARWLHGKLRNSKLHFREAGHGLYLSHASEVMAGLIEDMEKYSD